jgi:hypothetical protein
MDTSHWTLACTYGLMTVAGLYRMLRPGPRFGRAFACIVLLFPALFAVGYISHRLGASRTTAYVEVAVATGLASVAMAFQLKASWTRHRVTHASHTPHRD